MRALAVFVLLVTALAVATPLSQAQTPTPVKLVSNAGQARTGSSSSAFLAQSFTTGATTGGYTLSDVRIYVNSFQRTGWSTAVKIRENNASNQPGDVVATLANASLTSGRVNIFTAPANTTLSASTVYWVYVNDGVTGQRTNYSQTISNAQTGLTGWTIADTRLARTDESSSWNRPEGGKLSMQIQGYATSPPATTTTTTTTAPVNRAPVFAAASLTRSVAENTAANTNVGAVVPAATDADSGDTLTYSMVGADSASFSFDAATRQIKTKSGVSYDFETKSSYSVTIRVSDGTASDMLAVTINLTDVAEAPAAPAAPAVSATSGSTTSLNVAWTAPARNGGPALTGYEVQYRIGSSGSFRSWSHSGTSTSATITGLIADIGYQVQVRALNGETPSAWSPSGNGVTHANRVPVFAAASLTRSVAENTAANTNVGAVVPAATDADSGDTLTYSMVGVDSASFSFDAATRRIKTKSGVSYDFETKTSYSVTIRVSDGTAIDTVAVTITLSDVAEQPARPAAPSVSATSGSTTSVDVAWTAPGRNGGPALTGYSVQYRAGSSGVFRAWSHSGTSVSATITGLTANTSYQVQVRALNGETPSAWSPSGTGRTNSPANSAPVFAAASLTRSLAENTAANTNVGAVVPAATDADGDTLTYSMEGGDSVSFTFDAATRQIKTRSGVSYDFESNTTIFSVTIKASDGTASDTVTVTITLTDVAEQPARPAAPSVSATSGSTTSVDVAWGAPDRNGGPALTGYSVQYRAGSSGVFRSWSHSGTSVSATITGLTANTSYQVQVRALNGETPSAWSPSGTGRTNTPANSAPVFAAASLTRSVAENTAANTNVGAAVPAATDADSGDTLTYSMEGADSASFSFDAATRRIKTRSGVVYDFETKTSYSVTIKASDGTASDTVTVTITLTDVAEQPATPAAPTVSATSGSTTSVDVAWTAPDRNGGPVLTGYSVQYRAGSSGVFRAWSHSGTSVSATITGLTANTGYQVQIRALNGETPSGWSPSGTGRTNSPTNSAPVFAAASLTRSVAENTAANTNVGAVVPAATDADSGDTLTYSMEGADSASFSFDAATRRIKTRSGVVYDFETKTSYSVTIKASDGTASDTVPVTINLTDVAEQPATPAAPTVSATSGSTTSLNVAWSAPGRDGGPALVGYGVQYRVGSAGVFRSWSHSGTSVSATITGLSAGTGYEVQIRALNGDTPSGWSPSGSGRTSAPANNSPAGSAPAGRSPAGRAPAGGVPYFPPDVYVGGGGPGPSTVDYEWTVSHDIEGLDGGHDEPTGSWSDGVTLWIVDDGSGADNEVYAYGLAMGERVEGSEFVLDDANRAPRGLWSRTGIAWVSDSGRDRVFVYDLDSGDRLAEREIALDQANGDVRGIWSDGGTLWVLDRARALFAYDLSSGQLLAHHLLDRANSDPRDLWSDGVTVWVSDHGAERLFAYRLPVVPAQPGAVSAAQADSGEPRPLERVPREEFGELSGAGNSSPSGIWSDGDVMYVVDDRDRRVYTYNMPDAIDARLAALWLSGVDFGGFDRDRTGYVAVAGQGATETVVTAEATQRRADVEIKPGDSDAADGHQVALGGLAAITVTVTSADASRTKTYRVAFFAVPADVDAPGLHLAGAHPWVASDCSGDVPIIVASDADAQSDIYSAVTLAGIIGTDCVVLAGAREASMPQSQAARLAAAAHGGYVVGGEAAVPPAKLADRDMSRIWGDNRWTTAQKIADQATRPAPGTPAETPAAQPAPLPADVGAPGLHLAGAHPWVASDCSGDVPIIVASDAMAQSDIYSAVTLARIIGTDCVILAGAREAAMPHSQATRLAAAAPHGGYVIGGPTAVPAAKIADRHNITRIAGPNRWQTAQKVGHQARTLTNSTQ